MRVTLDVGGLSDRISSIKKLMVGRGNNSSSLAAHEESKYTQCTILNINAETDFKYYVSSRSLYEDNIVRVARKQSDSHGYKGKIPRTVLENCMLQDTNFPLYKNLLYKEPVKSADKIHLELNFYPEIVKVLYHLQGREFNHSQFNQQYTETELFILYDLLNAVVLGVIDRAEVEFLYKLLHKDPVLKWLHELILGLSKKNPSTVITELMGVVVVQDLYCAAYKNIMRQYLCQLMMPIVTQIYKGITSLQGTVVFKSISDFRYILTTSNLGCTEFYVELPASVSSLYNTLCPPIMVNPKTYVEDGYLSHVKSLLSKKA